jgi:hypothetical protein
MRGDFVAFGFTLLVECRERSVGPMGLGGGKSFLLKGVIKGDDVHGHEYSTCLGFVKSHYLLTMVAMGAIYMAAVALSALRA